MRVNTPSRSSSSSPISLILSWLVAVVFTPLLGVTLLPKTLKKHDEKPGRTSAIFRRLVDLVMRRAWLTVAISVGLFARFTSMELKFVQQQFFPPSARSELVVDFTLPQNASIAATKAAMDRFERQLAGNSDVDSWSSYVGGRDSFRARSRRSDGQPKLRAIICG